MPQTRMAQASCESSECVNALASARCGGLVRDRRAHDRGRQRHGRLVAYRPAGGASPRGVTRDPEKCFTAGAAVHRPRPRSSADPDVVRGDSAPVVEQGDRPHNALSARPVLDRHPAGRATVGPRAQGDTGCLVLEDPANRFGCIGQRPLGALARAGFGNVPATATLCNAT